MRRIVAAAAAGMLLAVVVLMILAWRAWTTGPEPVAGQGASHRVRVEPGATLHGVSADLQRSGLLRHRRLFLLMARLSGREQSLQVGRFDVPTGSSPREILTILLDGTPVPVVVTLPEGLEAPALAALVADSLGLDAAAILTVADSLVAGGADTLLAADERRAFAELVATGRRPDGRVIHWCEGYLAPDTYHFAEGTTAAAAAQTMIDLQLARVAHARRAALPLARPLTPHQLLSLASIVEAEARLASERGRIAGVYHNRLARGMRLEADPTVAFWLGKRGERLLYRDLEVDSPYNTYRRGGLPAGPIGAAGEAAIMATARPDTASGDLYFVADGAGGHVFSRTLADHQRAVAAYRALMRERRR